MIPNSITITLRTNSTVHMSDGNQLVSNSNNLLRVTSIAIPAISHSILPLPIPSVRHVLNLALKQPPLQLKITIRRVFTRGSSSSSSSSSITAQINNLPHSNLQAPQSSREKRKPIDLVESEKVKILNLFDMYKKK